MGVAVHNPLARRVARFLRPGTWTVDQHGRIRKGDFCQTYSGEWVYPLDPRADEIHYDDGCVGLARECRYGNQSLDFYSVAEHSVIVSLFVERFARERGWSEYDVTHAAQEGLLHDLPEAWLGDIPRPMKRQREFRGYARLEEKWWRCTVERFGLRLTEASSALVKEVDNRILRDEIAVLLVNPERTRTWRLETEPLGAEIACLPWERAADVFSSRFRELFPDFE